MENKVRNKILQVLNHKLSEIHEVLDQIDNCDMPDCEEPGFAWCEFHPERRICSYHATPDGEDLIYFCPECYQSESSVAESIDEAIDATGLNYDEAISSVGIGDSPPCEPFSTRRQDPNIREMCAKFLGVEPTETSDKTVTELVSEVIAKAQPPATAAQQPQQEPESIGDIK